MDVYATLVRVTAINIKTGNVEIYGLCDRNDPAVTTYDGLPWLPILQSSPTVGTSVFNGAFTGAGEMDVSGFSVTLVDGLGDGLSNLMWAGADIDVFGGKVGGVMKQLFTAVGVDALRKGRVELAVTIASKETLFAEAKVLNRAYAGSGNLEGEAAIKGVLKPWVFGFARYCKPVLIDSVRQIYQVSGYGPIQSTSDVFEGGLSINGFDGDKPIADILSNNGPAQGKWWRNNEFGVFRLGSQPLYEITCHAYGDTGGVVGGSALTKTGQIIGRIIAMTTPTPIKAASLANLIANAPQAIDEYLDTQETVSAVLTRLMLGLGGYYTFDENGNMIFGLMRFSTPTMNLDGLNRIEPTVLGINQLPSSAPIWDLRVAAEQCHFVHNAGDISGVLQDINDEIGDQLASKNRTFPASSQPPTGAVDGDQWPDTSTSPTTVRRYTDGSWLAISNQITAAAQVPFTNGKSVEELRPAQAGSDVTGQNTAQFINNQGWGATALRPTLDNTYIKAGANAVPNSDQTTKATWFTRYSPNGATIDPSMNLRLSREVWGTDNYALSGKTNNVVLRQNNRATGTVDGNGDDAVAFDFGLLRNDTEEFSLTCAPGERIIASAYVALHRCDALVILLFVNAQGQIVFAPASPRVLETNINANILSEPYYHRPSISYVAPAGTVLAKIVVRKYNTKSNQSDSYIWLAAPMLERGSDNQQDPSPYAPGPISYVKQAGFDGDTDADKTNRNTARYLENQGTFATRSSIASDADLSGTIANRLLPYAGDGNYLAASRMAWDTTGGTVQSLKPGEAGANITENRTALYLYNQGALATTDRVKLGSGGGMVDENNAYWLTSGIVVTAQGTAQYLANQGLLATRDNVSGGQVVNGAIASGNGVSYFDLDNGRLIFRVGGYMIVMGNAFGSSNQFTRWEGPSFSNLSQCTELNGVIWSKVDGTSYFGGGLSAGTRKNAVQTTVRTANPSIGTGPFGSGGGKRSVTVSYSFLRTAQVTGACPAGAITPSATLQVFRGSDASGEMIVNESFTGTYSCERGTPGEPGGLVESMSKAVSFDDNSGGTSAAFYARIINSSTNTGPDSQSLSIISIEQ